MAKKIVVTDYSFNELTIEQALLGPLGITLEGAQCRTVEEVAALAADADAVITQFAPVRAPAIAAMKKARAIIRYGIGYDNVDVEAAAARKIAVCNVPDYCLDEVADHTLAFILALTRQVLSNALVIRQGEWKSAVPLQGYRCLKHMVVGVIGFGRIGRNVVRRLASFGCTVLVFDPAVSAADVVASGSRPVTLDELFKESDLVTLHCPSLPSTKGMVNRARLAQMKAGSLLVNASRGDLVITPDVVDALQSGHLAGAAFDVTNPEPLPADSPLRSLPQVIVNPHVASASPQAVKMLRETVARLAGDAALGKPLRNVVNGV
jgi:D-3-phosphoglycerate dehydrogenase / 2-oxoglutarate reductase